MAESQTVGHQLFKYDTGDNPGANKLNANADKIDMRLMGIGNALPASWPVTGLFLHRPTRKVYENTGTISTPVWTLAVTAGVDVFTKEIPAGAINGVNTVFTLSNPPSVINGLTAEMVFVNGELMEGLGADYTLSGAVITFVNPLAVGDRLLVTYFVNN